MIDTIKQDSEWNIDDELLFTENEEVDEENLDDEIKFNLTSTPNDFNILTLISFIDKGIFKIPSFQRNYIWNKEKASRLIESLILGLPIPQIFLYEEKRNNLSIIDGQQRLLSIYFFYKGRFPKNDTARTKLRDSDISDSQNFIRESILNDDDLFTNFSLSLNTKLNPNKNNRLHNLNYSTLPSEDKINLELATIRNMIIKPESTGDAVHQAMFEIFNRLNSGGMNLNSQEIRMSLYACEFMSTLEKLNQNTNWRKLIGKEKIDIRLIDCEQILRLIAILLSGTENNPTRLSCNNNQFKSPLMAFLNRFAQYSRNLHKQDIELITRIWEEFMEYAAQLPTHIFSNSIDSSNHKISMPVLEAVLFACCKDTIDDPSKNITIPTSENIIFLKTQQPDFLKSATGKTSSRNNVYKRLDVAYESLKDQ